MTKPIIKITTILGALILLAGAWFHMTALPMVKNSTADIEPAFFKNGLPAMWILPALHWVFIACLSIGLSWYKSKACAAVLMAFGLWVLVDGLVAYLHVGLFMGVYMLGLAGVLLLAAGFMLRKAARAD